MPEISTRRLKLCTAFLDDCYALYDGHDLPSRANVVEQYLTPEGQATYSLMYFAKSVGCWWAIRDLVGVQRCKQVVSVGAGPMLCLMGWYFEQPPTAGDEIHALDFLDWAHVRNFPSHAALTKDILGGVRCKYHGGRYIPPESLPPQCVRTTVQPVNAVSTASFSPDATVLVPMLLNHIVGAEEPMASAQDLVAWFIDLAARVERIIIVDIELFKAPLLWRQLEAFTGLPEPEEEQPLLKFADRSRRFEPCYPDATFKYGPESTRRTGIRAPQFCEVTACMFERGRGWRWLSK